MNEKLIKDHPFGFMAILSAIVLCVALILTLIAPGSTQYTLPFIAVSMIWGGLCTFFEFMTWTMF